MLDMWALRKQRWNKPWPLSSRNLYLRQTQTFSLHSAMLKIYTDLSELLGDHRWTSPVWSQVQGFTNLRGNLKGEKLAKKSDKREYDKGYTGRANKLPRFQAGLSSPARTTLGWLHFPMTSQHSWNKTQAPSLWTCLSALLSLLHCSQMWSRNFIMSPFLRKTNLNRKVW